EIAGAAQTYTNDCMVQPAVGVSAVSAISASNFVLASDANGRGTKTSAQEVAEEGSGASGDNGEGTASDNGCPEVRPPDPTAETAGSVESPPGALCPQPLPASSDRQPVLEGDRRREALRARNREALQRFEAELRGRQR